jgi:hypothetical protein
MRNLAIVALTGTLLLIASTGTAQTWSERVYVSVNGAFQSTTNDFGDRFEFDKDLETGSTDVDYRVGSGVVFDGGGGVRLWKNFGVGAAVSVFNRKNPADTTTRSPHPFLFNQGREVTGAADDITRTETAVHVQAMYFLATSGHLRVVLSGGPTFFRLKQDLVSEVALTETFPYDTAAFSTVRKQTITGTAPSFNVGADVVWMLRPGFGVGGLVRFSRASIDLDAPVSRASSELNAPSNRTVSVDGGGIYAGGGIRLLF